MRGTSACHEGPVTDWPAWRSSTNPIMAANPSEATKPADARTWTVPAATSTVRESYSSTIRPAQGASTKSGRLKAISIAVMRAGCSLSATARLSTTKAIESPRNDSALAGTTRRMSGMAEDRLSRLIFLKHMLHVI